MDCTIQKALLCFIFKANKVCGKKREKKREEKREKKRDKEREMKKGR